LSKLIAVLVLFVTASGTSALADGYSDFNAGITASEFADPQIVIGHLSQAIASQDLPQHLLPTALKARGYDYLTTKNYDGAIADFAAALHLRPNAPDLYLGLCSAYESKHMTAEALSNCAQAAALQPDNLRVNEFLDEIYIQMGREDDAIANYSKFIAARPQNLALVLARANLYVQTGRYDYALPDALAAVNLDPDNATLYGFLSRVYLVKGDLQKAQENIETDIGKDGTDPLAYLAKGQVL
jgi:tetratricopeptide (TPR) repeat protein